MVRSHAKRVFERAKNVAADATFVKEIDLRATAFLNVMVRATYQNTHASTSGVEVTGVYGMIGPDGTVVWDTSSTPIDFGDVNVTLNQSDETVGTLQFKVPVNDVPTHLQLSCDNKDATNPCVIDIFGCA